MRARFLDCTKALLILAIAGAAGCSDDAGNPVAPPPVVGLGPSITAEPQSPRPEFLPQFPCPAQPVFGLGLTIVVNSHDREVALQALRFTLIGLSGARALPDVFAASLPLSRPIPIPSPATLPGSPPVGVPGSTPIRNVAIGSGSARSLPFFLRFACGTVPEGTLVVTAETTDAMGAIRTSELRVAVNP